MTVINPNSISGITSITLPSGGDNVLTIHTNDGTERFRIDSSGNVKVGTAATISPDGDVFFTGVTTATTFTGAHSGSGANLTSLPAAQLTGTLPAISGANLTGIAATDNVRTGILDVAGIATFRNNVNVGTAVTITESGIEATGVGITVANINGGSIGGRRNKIINGEFRINQRNHSGSAGHNVYTFDRWKYGRSANTEFSQTQSTDTPDGFANSVKMDCIGATGSTGTGDYAYWRYHIEGQDLQDLNKGTSAAQPFTLSFYFKSDITGTFAISITDENSRMCNANYTVSDTNWNRYVITIPADTTGTIANTNAAGLEVRFYIIAGTNHTSGSAVHTWGSYSASSLATGHTANIVSTDHNLYLTGVQLEVGSQATAFEHRSFAEELALCQRYYYIVADGSEDSQLGTGFAYHANQPEITLHYPVMRASPSLVHATGTNYYHAGNNNNNATWDSFSWYQATTRCGLLYQGNVGGSPLSSGQAYRLQFNSDQAYIHLSAEL